MRLLGNCRQTKHISFSLVLENQAEKRSQKAIVALARKLLVIIYTMLKQGTNFDENCFEVRRKNCEQKQLSRYIRELEKHGYTVEAQV